MRTNPFHLKISAIMSKIWEPPLRGLFVRTHFLGMVAQVAAAAPVPVASIMLARTAGLESAGYLAFGQGILALLFTLSNFGLRSVLAVDGVAQGDISLYWKVRVWSTAATAVLCSLIALLWFRPALILVGLMLLRVGDSFLDLSLGFRQASQEATSILQGYAREVIARFVLFIILLTVGILIWQVPLPAFAGAAAGASLYVTVMEYRKIQKYLPAAARGRCSVRQLLTRAFPFASATVLISVIFSLPRLLAKQYYSGDEFGAAGVALLFVTFAGMAFYTSWIRANVELRKNGFQIRFLKSYIVEVGFMLVICVGVLYGLLPIVGIVYGIDQVQLLDLIFKVAVGGLLLNACLGVQNFFKVSKSPGAESVSYCVGAGAMVVGYLMGIGYVELFYVASAGLLLAGGVLAVLITRMGVRNG